MLWRAAVERGSQGPEAVMLVGDVRHWQRRQTGRRVVSYTRCEFLFCVEIGVAMHRCDGGAGRVTAAEQG